MSRATTTIHSRSVFAAVLALAVAAPAWAGPPIVLPRAGQVGISLQGGYGSLVKGNAVGDAFGDGASFAIRLRYRMRYERGLGLSFESNRFDATTPVVYDPADVDGTTAPERLGVVLSGLEFYQLFGTRTPTVRLLSAGIGIAQQRVKLNSGETELSGTFSGDGPFLSVGAGVERFVWRSWALDVSARYYAMFKDGKAGHNVQLALGVIGYAAY